MSAYPQPLHPDLEREAHGSHGGHPGDGNGHDGNGHNGDGHGHHAHPELSFWKKYIFSGDHKIIGIQFLLLGLLFFVVGGLLAMLVRWQLAWPNDPTHPVPILGKFLGWPSGVMPDDFYTMAFSMHATIMIFFVIIPLLVGTFGNYLIPLKIGAADMAFPFLNGMAFWSALPAGAIMVAGFFIQGGHAQAGWTVYPPLSAIQQGKGEVAYVAPATGWENFVAHLRNHETGATFSTDAKPTWGEGTLSQTFTGDSAKIATAFERAARELGDEDAAKRQAAVDAAAKKAGDDAAKRDAAKAAALETAKKTTPFASLQISSADGQGVKAKLEDGSELVATVTRADASGGGAAVHVGAAGVENLSRRFLARTATKLKDVKSWQSPWQTSMLMSTFFGWFMCFLFICAYYVRVVPENKGRLPNAARTVIGPVLFVVGLCAMLFPHYASTTGGTAAFVACLLLTLEGLLLMCGAGVNRQASVAVSLVAGYFALKATQSAAFDGQSCWFLSVIILGFSSIMGAVNYLTTVVKLRCPGMTMFRMPLSVWSIFITSILVLLATPVLASVLTMNLLDHHRLTSFFLPFNWTYGSALVPGFSDAGQLAVSNGVSGGGYVILHQHLFWFYSHPAVYIMILPAMGMVSDIIAVFARKPIFGYRPMVYAMAGIAFLGFIVWAHHMFQSGMNPTLGTTFAVSTMFIAVPSAIKTFNWLGTLWGGNIRFTAAMCNAIAFVAMFVIGGLSGIFMASTAVDVHIHDTYFIVAHIHYVLFGGTIFGIFGSIYFWYPKMFGRMMNETMGKIHFVLSFIFFNCTFFPMHILGIGGMARRVADPYQYSTFKHFQPMNQFITWSALMLGLSQLPFVINFLGSWVWGRKASANPWEATTLEWNDTTSPPPHGNFAAVPVVHHGPYEYSSPLVAEDWLPQTKHVEGAEQFAGVGH